MPTITYEEQQLMALYNSAGTRTGLIAALREMREHLGPEDIDLRMLTDSAIGNSIACTSFAPLPFLGCILPHPQSAEKRKNGKICTKDRTGYCPAERFMIK